MDSQPAYRIKWMSRSRGKCSIRSSTTITTMANEWLSPIRHPMVAIPAKGVNYCYGPTQPREVRIGVNAMARSTSKKSTKVAKKAADKQVAGRPPKAVSNSSDDSSVSERIEERIVELGDWRGERLAEIRRLIHEVDPDVVEDWKWRGTPVWSHEGMYANANAFKDKVKLTFFHGAELPDPNSLFNAGRREQVAGNRLPRGR